MNKRFTLGFAALVAGLFPAMAQMATIVVSNPADIFRQNELVSIPWQQVSKKIPQAKRSQMRLQDETGSTVVVQADDIDFNGTPDELVFQADFGPKQRRTFSLKLDADAAPTDSTKTDAQNFKRINGVLQSLDDDDGPGLTRAQSFYRFDGVGWESQGVGYRVYLDERNAVDIQGKRKPGLYWKYIGTTTVDYQQDLDWGMDVLHVGPALGVGGIGFWVGDTVLKPVGLSRRRCRIVARGPVCAVVRIDYFGWDVGGEKIDLTSLFMIAANTRVTEHRVILRSGKLPKTLATGIVKHAGAAASVWNEALGSLSTLGPQSRANDTLFMALQVSSENVLKRTEDRYNHLLLLKLKTEEPLRILISSLWQGENGTMWAPGKVEEFMRQTSLKLSMPLKVQVQ